MHADAKTRSAMSSTLQDQEHRTSGIVLHSPVLYDLTVWFAFLGRERAFRDRLIEIGHIANRESVLDVGCGTGTLAIAGKRRVGAAGSVAGIDASPEMIARAKNKARNSGVDVFFQNALAEALPFPAGQFDAVLSTVMLHHLPRKPRQQCASEIRRVLKPGGRVLAVDFAGGTTQRTWLPKYFHCRHGRIAPKDLIALFTDAGLRLVDNGPLGFGDMHYVLAEAPTAAVGNVIFTNGTNP